MIIRNTAPHASFIEHGTKPHVIRARRVNFLRFEWPRGSGNIVFRRAVYHPGNRAYRFLWDATTESFRVFGFLLAADMQRVAQRFNAG